MPYLAATLEASAIYETEVQKSVSSNRMPAAAMARRAELRATLLRELLGAVGEGLDPDKLIAPGPNPKSGSGTLEDLNFLSPFADGTTLIDSGMAEALVGLLRVGGDTYLPAIESVLSRMVPKAPVISDSFSGCVIETDRNTAGADTVTSAVSSTLRKRHQTQVHDLVANAQRRCLSRIEPAFGDGQANAPEAESVKDRAPVNDLEPSENPETEESAEGHNVEDRIGGGESLLHSVI